MARKARKTRKQRVSTKKITTKKKTKKLVYFFGGKQTEGRAEQKDILGGKGANLAEMCRLGLPVPPGFTITAEACAAFQDLKGKWPKGLKEEVLRNIKKLENMMSAKLGDPKKTLLVSVRSGAAISMPGMMDTVLNLGLCPEVVQTLGDKMGNPRFAWDAYRRFIQMFGDVVMGVPHDNFEAILQSVKEEYGVKSDTDLDEGALHKVVKRYLKLYKKFTREDFPLDPMVQLEKAINAVFGSWNNPRAVKYRELNDIKGLLGTAVNVQTMVFGNLGETSGTGVAFTRNPATGTNKFYGEFLMNAQGEDVVAGIRTPRPIQDLAKQNPAALKELMKIRKVLEKHYKDMQDIEFTIQEGKLYMLQTRTGKRTAAAALKVAVDMVKERLITREQAVLRIDPSQLDQVLHPTFDPKSEKAAKLLTKGLPASPGAASGKVVFTAEEAEEWAAKKEKVILVRTETSPEDIGGMNAAQGILTARGGMTSHAAVVARGMGKCCVAGAGGASIDSNSGKMIIAGVKVSRGDWISLNGSTGAVYLGRINTTEPKLTGDFKTLMGWADKFRRLGVRTNADTPHDTAAAVRFGAEGIGLCRTEHMFFEGDRILAMREMILADDLEGRKKALAKLLPMQRNDFIGIFKALKGRPCTIRLLDPPLHEFLPHDKDGQQEIARIIGVNIRKVKEKVEALSEFNPMLGFRGCRLGLIYPEINTMQVRAIVEAAIKVKQSKTKVRPEIMIPLVGKAEELAIARKMVEQVIGEVFKENKIRKGSLPISIGTMIEVPRAAVTADEIAAHADFFSFGTNDLTQMGCGFSRDDAGKFLPKYVEMGIYEYDPFQSLDEGGVGRLVDIAVQQGRKTNKGLKLGICGEHGGDPRSVEFCHRVGLNYVSCSPFRVPIARLAAAQAALREKSAKKTARR
ncbi:MAG: pyruvate, phosphate dikinase [Deltaproteobacteria bacterium]|nr:pyruvate, phosphate dikinase [Deltaproteobacteria bacterium]